VKIASLTVFLIAQKGIQLAGVWS